MQASTQKCNLWPSLPTIQQFIHLISLQLATLPPQPHKETSMVQHSPLHPLTHQ